MIHGLGSFELKGSVQIQCFCFSFFFCRGLGLGFVLYNGIESLQPATWSSTHIAPLPVRLAFSGGKSLPPFESWCLSFWFSVALKSSGYLNATIKDFVISLSQVF